MKKIFTLILAVMLTAAALNAEEKPAEAKKPVGISFGLNYYSLYLWRGVNWFDGDGAFTPFISYDIAGIGLVLTITGELSASGVSTQQFPRNTYSNIFSYSRQGVDFALDYSIAIAKIAVIKLNATYFLYPISKEYLGANYNDMGNPNAYQTVGWDQSDLALTAGIYFDGIPLKPYVSYTHDFFLGNSRFRYTDFYIKIGVAQDFELAKDLTFTIGAYMGLFNNPSFNYTRAEAYKGDKFGISELALTSALAYKIAGFTFTLGFTYINFPYPEKFEAAIRDMNRYVATLGTSYSF
jgi:hypothetical protein